MSTVQENHYRHSTLLICSERREHCPAEMQDKWMNDALTKHVKDNEHEEYANTRFRYIEAHANERGVITSEVVTWVTRVRPV